MEDQNLTEVPETEPFDVKTEISKSKMAYGFHSKLSLSKPSIGKLFGCREQFHKAAKDSTKSFYYGDSNPFAVVAIIDWVERSLNIHHKHRCKITVHGENGVMSIIPEDVKNYLYINLNGFWKADPIRFYFLTIVCRANTNINNCWKTPLDALLQSPYLKGTRKAFLKFMQGYTLYKGKCPYHNWCDIFNASANADDLQRPATPNEREWFYDKSPIPQISPDDMYRINKWAIS